MKAALRVSLAIVGIGIAFVAATNIWMIFSTAGQLQSIEEIPEQRVALVLGTSKRTSDGEKNQFFEERMNTAARLYLTGKISHILVSGDNRSVYYNEPKDMLNALEARGVDKRDVTLDYAGLRTLDSVVRCKSVFGHSQVVIVTQEFHLYRALFIANYLGMEATGAIAAPPDTPKIRIMLRELIARPLAVLDLYIWKRAK